MSSYFIKGGNKLKGEITVNSSKNASTGILVASLMNNKKTTIKNLPRIEEVFRIIEVMESIGMKAVWRKKSELIITPPKKFNLKNINKKSAEKTRSIVMFIGALSGKLKKFELPMQGGCKLGKRSLMPHAYALDGLGVKIKNLAGKLVVDSTRLRSSENIVMYESGDTATENAIMAASLAPGKTVIKFASANYQIQDLCYFLEELGVKIDGIGTTTLTIHGKKKISKKATYNITEDPIEAMFFLALGITTKSSIVIKRCPIEFLTLELYKLEKMGFKFKILRKYKARNKKSILVDIETFPSELKAPVEKLYGRPFPGLNIDNLPFFAPIATQAKGETMIHDWVYENRAIYFTELNRLDANVRLVDAHRVFIKGPTQLKGAEMICPPALRPSASLLVAMLSAKGKSVLKNTYAIERGYERLDARLKALGANIKRVEE